MKPLRPLLPFLLALAIAACSADDPAALVASAKDYIAQRDYNASIIQLKNALQKEPENAEARYLLGLASLEIGDLRSAEIELNKALELGLKTYDVEVALARTLLAQGSADKVLAQFGARKLSDPKAQAELRALVGMAQLASNQRKQAQATFGEALSAEPSNVTGNLGMALLAASEGQLAKALKQVDAALAGAPNSFQAHLAKGDILAAQGQAEAAESAYREAVRLAPSEFGARLNLITHLIRQGAVEKASAEVDALERAAPKDPRTLYARALVLMAQRKYAEAKEAAVKVLASAPNHVPTLTLAGMAAFQARAYPEAESYLRKVLAKSPNSVAVKRALAATRLRMGQLELALKDVSELLDKAGNDPNVVALAGEVHAANGDIANAARYYEKAKSLQPGNVAFQTRLAQIHFAAGETERGIKELEAASLQHPDAYQADLQLVAMHLRKREADKALEALGRLEKKQPDSPITNNLRGLALLLKRDFTGARKSFERAVELRSDYMPAVASLARMDLREKNPAAARKRYEAVLQQDPRNERALRGLAILYRVTGEKPEETEKLLKRGVTANPASAAARTALVTFYLRSKDPKRALAAAQEAHVALPGDASVLEMLGLTQLAAKDTRQAIATFTQLAELTPRSPKPHLHLARAHMSAKRPDSAITALRAALALAPELESAQRDIAAIYVTTGRTAEAVREARQVQTDHPDKPLGFALEAEIELAQKNLGNAERIYRGMLKSFDLPRIVMRTHAVMRAAGKEAEADAIAEDWVARHPKDAAVINYLAERDLASKRYASAAKRFLMALERRPDTPLILNNLAWANHQLKRPEALEYAERAYELAPNSPHIRPHILHTLGWILTQRGELERGLELLSEALDLAPNAHGIRLHLAKALIQANRKDAAREELKVLEKLDTRLTVQKEAAALLGSL
jgi:putative PEP-CTERM system TPR-repeat lipoprotein